ncbi:MULTISPECIES: tyrosine-type recombinase/integrase [unclassified Pseudomonas]|uniref:tyrosine-type recombinase/integrase n=1 Tax=unclassified Pseudomonas TaxID=196821 RepID=UPI000C2FC565|nr:MULTISPECIES: tyrosine-type recombinase/integrase [unclassified Pseudomonas]MCU1737226.1 tyrosine-type recombinase/integrase [Pseudomonas sp. 20S_6.2_Bac1]
MRDKAATTLLQTILAKPWVYRRNGRYYLRMRPVGLSSGFFSVSLRTTERPQANELTKDILSALAVFHLDNPEASWADIKDRLSVVSRDALLMTHTDASLVAYESIYEDLHTSLRKATATMGLSPDQHRGAAVAQRILDASVGRLRGDATGLLNVIGELTGGDNRVITASPEVGTQPPLRWEELWPKYLKEKAGNLKEGSIDIYMSNYTVIGCALTAVGVLDLRKHTREDLVDMREELLETRKPITVNTLLTSFSSVMNWAVANDFLTKAYVTKLKLTKGIESERIPFERHQVETIMAHANSLPVDAWERWGLSLLAITGARAREVTQLTKDDIVNVEGVTCIHIHEGVEGQSIKNKYSERMVPLVDGLMGFDLSAFLQALNGPNPPLVSGTGIKHHRAREIFNDTLRELLPNKDKNQTLHSLRHHMATSCKNKGIAVNDLREFDLSRITPSYDRRVNGDIGIMGATGRTTGELLHDITKVKASSKAEKAALAEAMKILTGRARQEPEGALATTARILSDLGFVAKNAYMGVQSISEVAGMVTKGHTHMLLKGVPLLREMTQWGSKISTKDLKDMHSMVFGRELDNHLRPTRTDIVERLRDQADVSPLTANVVGSLKYATQEISARSPFTKFLTESSNYIADAGRSGVLSDLVDHVLAGRQSSLFDPQRLHSMSISPEQFEGIKAAIREHMVVGKNGKYTIKDRAALQRDPRTMDMWRMGDKIAHETILRPHALSSADTVAYGAGVKMAMQFKNFTMRSVNSRLVRGFHDATKNGRAIDQTMQAVLSTGLAVSTYVAMKYSQAAGMPKDQRDGFLKNSLDPKMLGYAGLSRSSHIGAPLGLLNIVAAPFGFDQGAAVRSSILPRGPKEKPELGAMKYSATQDKRFTGFLGRVTEQVPAMGVLANGYQTGYNAFGALGRAASLFSSCSTVCPRVCH